MRLEKLNVFLALIQATYLRSVSFGKHLLCKQYLLSFRSLCLLSCVNP